MPITDPEIEMYTDGGCEPNPGPGGYGVVLRHPKKRAEVSGGFRKTTNNRMEIFAAIAGLELLKQTSKVTLYSDSEYLVNAMTKGWVESWKRKQWRHSKTERVPNCELWERLLGLCEKHQVEFRWVKGHAGLPENERCDQLAMAALREANLPIDEGYENKPESEGVQPDMQEGDPCRKCSAPVVKQEPRARRNRGFYYEYYLWCPKCQATYEVESAKRFVEPPPSLF
ncbi:MAG TPA: ribonuclease HI [Verrucomicrobiae bacterium]